MIEIKLLNLFLFLINNSDDNNYSLIIYDNITLIACII